MTAPLRMDNLKCPHCGFESNAVASAFYDALPKPDDLTVCQRCIGVSVFDERLELRAPSVAEQASFMENPDLQLACRSLRSAQ